MCVYFRLFVEKAKIDEQSPGCKILKYFLPFRSISEFFRIHLDLNALLTELFWYGGGGGGKYDKFCFQHLKNKSNYLNNLNYNFNMKQIK